MTPLKVSCESGFQKKTFSKSCKLLRCLARKYLCVKAATRKIAGFIVRQSDEQALTYTIMSNELYTTSVSTWHQNFF